MKKRLLILLLLLSLLLGGCYLEYVPENPEASETTPPSAPAETMTVHFLDVGQADCALVELGDFTMLIDGGNKADGQFVVSYLLSHGIEELDALVCTHAHEDHVGGLAAVLAVFPTAQVYAPTRTYSSKVFENFLYYADQQGLEVTIPSPGDRIPTGEDLEIAVLGPVKSYPEPNNTSIVLMLQYGETTFLFTGDMETDAENDLLDHWEGSFTWDTTVLKTGHHGSYTSTGHRFLYETMPQYAVISVGADNSYGHPHEEVLSRLQDAGTQVLRTDELGTVLACSDGKTVTFSWENSSGS